MVQTAEYQVLTGHWNMIHLNKTEQKSRQTSDFSYLLIFTSRIEYINNSGNTDFDILFRIKASSPLPLIRFTIQDEYPVTAPTGF